MVFQCRVLAIADNAPLTKPRSDVTHAKIRYDAEAAVASIILFS